MKFRQKGKNSGTGVKCANGVTLFQFLPLLTKQHLH
jgi:hypothetical protein